MSPQPRAPTATQIQSHALYTGRLRPPRASGGDWEVTMAPPRMHAQGRLPPREGAHLAGQGSGLQPSRGPGRGAGQHLE